MTQLMHARSEARTHDQPIVATAELSDKQLLAVRQLAEGRSYGDVARSVGISRSTLHRWRMQEPRFRAALDAWRADAVDGARHRLTALAEEAAEVVATAVGAGNVKLAMQLLKLLGVAETPGRTTRPPVVPEVDDGDAVDTLRGDDGEQEADLKFEISDANVDRHASEAGARCATAATASDLKFEISNADVDRHADETGARCAEASVDHAADAEAATSADLKFEISNADVDRHASEAGARCATAAAAIASDLKFEISNVDVDQRASETGAQCAEAAAVDHVADSGAAATASDLKFEISNADVDRHADEAGARCATAAAATASDLKSEISNADVDRHASEAGAQCAEAAAVDHVADSGAAATASDLKFEISNVDVDRRASAAGARCATDAAAIASDLKSEISNADPDRHADETGARCATAAVDHAADAEVGQPVGAAELARDDAKSASPATEDASAVPAVETISTTNDVVSGPSPEQLELLRWRRMPFEQRSRRIEARMRELQAQINLARHGAGCANVAAVG